MIKSTTKNSKKKLMTRDEWIAEANEIGYSEKEIAKWLKKHDDDEKKYDLIIPYELLPLMKISINTHS